MTLVGLESDDSPGVVVGRRETVLGNLAACDRSLIGEGTVEDEHEIVLEVMWYASAVLGSISHNHVFLWDNLYVRAFVKGIYHDIRAVGLRKGETHHGRTLGRSYLGCHVVVGQIYLVVVGTGGLGLVREP